MGETAVTESSGPRAEIHANGLKSAYDAMKSRLGYERSPQDRQIIDEMLGSYVTMASELGIALVPEDTPEAA